MRAGGARGGLLLALPPALLLLLSLCAMANILFAARLPLPLPLSSSSSGGLRGPSAFNDSPSSRVCSSPPLMRKTSAKGLACPIFRDEEGFLSEFVAYYQLHGLHHIKLYDDGSTDNSLLELEPWVQAGFVSVERNVSALFQEALAAEAEAETWEWYTKILEHGERIAMQFFAHNHCKDFAIKNNFDYLFTLDIDEYMVPDRPGITVMDAVDEWSKDSSYLISYARRVNFASTPHILEPVNKLTIEAYNYRMALYGRLNYFRAVQPKLIFSLNYPVDPSYETFIKSCCDIHSCGLNCTDQPPEVISNMRKVNNSTSSLSIAIFHYARSLEKYDLKRRTWSNYNMMSYSLTEYMDRNLGRTIDRRAGDRYSCQIREILTNMTGVKDYLRPGNSWYRNVEYNKSLLDEDKVYHQHLNSSTITNFSTFSGNKYRSMVDRPALSN